MKVLFISLGITTLISIGLGFVLKDFIGFWQGVVGAFIVQFITFYILSSRGREEVEEAASSVAEIIDLQTMPINCPCGKNTITAPIFFNTDNQFTCEKCGSVFRVEPSFDVVLLTEPLNIENIFNKLKEQSDNKV
jgi:hypothetical protein